MLTIAIPTFQRPNELRSCLKSIISGIHLHTGIIRDIRIYVSDNDPKRSAECIVREFPELQIEYDSSEKNLGYDGNIYKILCKIRYGHVLFISDDDVFRPHFLGHYLDLCNQNIHIIFTKAEFLTYDLSQPVNFSDSSMSGFQTTSIFKDFAAYIDVNQKINCGLSGLCIDVEKLPIGSLKGYLGTNFLHVAAYLLVARSGGVPIAVIGEPQISYRTSHGTEAVIKDGRSILSVGIGIVTVTELLRGLVPATKYMKIRRKERNWLRRLFLGVKAREGLSRTQRDHYKALLKDVDALSITDRLVINLPCGVLNLLYRVYKLVPWIRTN
jgi:Glycosyl transferase family 2